MAQRARRGKIERNNVERKRESANQKERSSGGQEGVEVRMKRGRGEDGNRRWVQENKVMMKKFREQN